MSSSSSSDEFIKQEIINTVGYQIGKVELRIFPGGSNQDQYLFSEGGLTFKKNGVAYGSCDAVWYLTENGEDIPVLALEGTDALNRKSSGNAQYQRFHHALGSLRCGIISVYYLHKGTSLVRPELYGMAYFASKTANGYYLITQDLNDVKTILNLINNGLDSDALKNYLDSYLDSMYTKFNNLCFSNYQNDWNIFAEKRSTLIFDDYIIKHAGRMKRNFTDSSQRAGHIAVGEMYLSTNFFPKKHLYYLFAKMTQEDFQYLDRHKTNDKEWYLLRNEPNVTIIGRDSLINLPKNLSDELEKIKDDPLKGSVITRYNTIMKTITELLKSGEVYIKTDH